MTNPRIALPLLAAAIAAPCLTLASRGQDAAKAAEDGVAHWRRAAASYAISRDAGPSRRPLTLREEPVLRWNNPVRKALDGAVFVWTDRGRPEVAAAMYSYGGEGSTKEDHEFMSLSTSSLEALRGGATAWAPESGGVILRPIPDAPKPASSSAERLRQMRALARDFHAYFDNPPDRSEIRLLTQPIYRYEVPPDRADVTDGGLFAFVHTTDPEVLLQVELRVPDGGGPPAWHYALARMSLVNMRVRYKDREVWSAAWDSDVKNPRKPYMARTEDGTAR